MQYRVHCIAVLFLEFAAAAEQQVNDLGCCLWVLLCAFVVLLHCLLLCLAIPLLHVQHAVVVDSKVLVLQASLSVHSLKNVVHACY